MKRVLLIALGACSLLHAQIVVQAGKQARMPVSGATSAVSLDSKIADASVTEGVMSITGIGPGDTRIIAMRWNGMDEFQVHVTLAPPAYPPGFVAPYTVGSENGSVEFRFSSDQMRFDSAVDLYSQGLNRTRQLHAVSSTLFSNADGDPRAFVPSAFYKITTPHVETTLLDQTVNNSSLTLQNVVLRGLHVKDGPWQFHGGYTASADFADVFLPTEKEFAAGAGYSMRLASGVVVTPNVYFLRSIDLATGSARSGVISSLLFDFLLRPTWELKSEVAYGRGAAFAGELQHSGANGNIRARLVDKKPDFPSVRYNSLPGLLGELSLTQNFTPRLGVVSGGSINRIELKGIEQHSQNAFGNVRFKLTRSWTVGTGANYGAFTSSGLYSARTLSLPQQISFDRTHFGAGFQYDFSTASNSFSNGNGITQTLRLNLGRFQIGEFVSWQNDALSVNSLYSQIPGLQQQLQQQGISAVTPEQLSALLQNAAFLQSLGFSSQARIVTVPHRLQEGANLNWTSSGAHPHRLSLSLIENHNQFVANSSNDYNLAGNYVKEIGNRNQAQISWSFFHSALSGRDLFTPLVAVSFRHTFSRTPDFFSARKNGSISGTVFIDAPRRGIYEPGMETVSKALVILDGGRTVATDHLGHYYFGSVPEGQHRIQVNYESDRPHYFTTPNNTVIASGSTINFGIAFSTLDLWGYVEDDAGNGLERVELRVAGPSGAITLTTDNSGKFILPGAGPGNYQVQVNIQSVALGYATEQLSPVDVTVTATSSGHPIVKIAANRTLTGTVSAYDPAVGSYVPIKGAVVTIPQLDRRVVTNAAGKFTIGQLPPGELEVRVAAGKASFTHTISLPAHPITLRDDFHVSSVTGQITFTLASASY